MSIVVHKKNIEYGYQEYSSTKKKKKKNPNVFGNLEQHAKKPIEPKFQPFWKVLEYIK